MEGKETEPGQSHPTILLYDDMTKFKNITDESKKEYTVTITLDGASEKEVVPPYNPFIFISSNEGRGKELHLINYPLLIKPTYRYWEPEKTSTDQKKGCIMFLQT